MLITNDRRRAALADQSGVDRLFVDLELIGKFERQGHRDALISHHTVDDVRTVRFAAPGRELLVRLNPLHAGTAAEVEQTLEAGADLLMLPMFRSIDEVIALCRMVAGRVPVVPLVETREAMELIADVVRLPGVGEVYFGLNDLHLSLGRDFMFELLAGGEVEEMAAVCRAASMPFGFGGVARIGEGLLPGELVLAEHLRLGSQSVILSRTFHRREQGEAAEQADAQFVAALKALRAAEMAMTTRTPAEVECDRRRVVDGVLQVVRTLRTRRETGEGLVNRTVRGRA